MTSLQQITDAAIAAQRALVRRLFLDRQAEFWLGEVDPVRSLREIRARVVDVIDETADTRTLVLRPNGAWRGHLAGQHTTVEVEIDGVRVRRCYSISTPPGAPHPAITVKRMPGGRVSGWLHRHVRRGSVLRLGPARGDFVLPEPVPRKLLLFSGGSGITPVMSMLRDLDVRDAISDVVFVHHARRRQDVIFGAALDTLAARHPGLRLHVRLDDEGGAPGFDEARFAALIPDFAERVTFACGPGPLVDRLEQLYAAAGASARFRRERFVLATPAARASGPVELHLTRSGRKVVAAGTGTLLEQLERAGENPPSGCRMGVCHTCRCRKRGGTVENLLTGAVSGEPDEEIQLCISVPRSDVELEL